MRIQQLIIGMALFLSLGAAKADETRHFMGFSTVSFSDANISSNAYQYGYDFSNLISVEVNLHTPEISGAAAATLNVDLLASVMLRLNHRYESINTYFVIGASNINFTDATTDNNVTGLSYGVGIELYGSKNTAITFSYTVSEYEEGTSVPELKTTSVGLVHHFDFGKSTSRY